MTRLAEELPVDEEPYAPFGEPGETANHEAVNFALLAAHQVLLRIGWIFKTESIVMPVFLSYVGGGPLLLGMLPVLNRLGFSVPPLLYAARLKTAPRKRVMVTLTTLGMAAPFAALSALWFSGAWRGASGAAPWMPYLFLAVYGVFFSVTGMNQLGMHTLQGKLIRANLRGRLFTTSTVVGAPLAVLAAWQLLPGWLNLPDGGFGWVFGFTATLFVGAAAAVAFAVEPSDNFRVESTNPWQKFHDAWRVMQRDPRARPVAILAALVSANFSLFPHYQSLYPRLEGAGVTGELGVMMQWVCVQNAATALFSLIAGPVADRLGNRAALRLTVAGMALGPIVALGLAYADDATSRSLFWLVFATLGFTPVTVKLLINYTLEAAPADDHPRFVAAVGMGLAIPVIVGSPLVGLLAGELGRVPVFLAGLVVLLGASVQALRLSEPRHA